MTTLAVNALTQKPALERAHFSGPSGGSHTFHSYSKSKGGGKKHSIALTALTLLSFLFFLNILQQCLQEHMDDMNPPTVMVMQAQILKLKEAKEAQKRKGESDLVVPSSKTNKAELRATESSRDKPKDSTVYPIKLKTLQKGYF